MQTITATDLARNTRNILDRVATSGECVLVERNHVVVAQIVPSSSTNLPQLTAAQVLAGLTFPALTPAQANAWLEDSKNSFSNAVGDPWA